MIPEALGPPGRFPVGWCHVAVSGPAPPSPSLSRGNGDLLPHSLPPRPPTPRPRRPSSPGAGLPYQTSRPGEAAWGGPGKGLEQAPAGAEPRAWNAGAAQCIPYGHGCWAVPAGPEGTGGGAHSGRQPCASR